MRKVIEEGITDKQLYDNAMRDRRQLENNLEYLKYP